LGTFHQTRYHGQRGPRRGKKGFTKEGDEKGKNGCLQNVRDRYFAEEGLPELVQKKKEGEAEARKEKRTKGRPRPTRRKKLLVGEEKRKEGKA